jgi:2-C-methyl-D-erythritol 2,4-cyclodiphosphate synthase
MFRVGIGHDTHRIAADRPLILGGLRIEWPRGLVGHSDADVVLHALTDAILGAVGLGDIGDMYPDTDPANKDVDSRVFLEGALARIREKGYRIGNVDIVIFAQEPKLGPVKVKMREHLAKLLAVDVDQVNVKAKTGEKVGHIGRAEAIGCQAIVLVERGVA